MNMISNNPFWLRVFKFLVPVSAIYNASQGLPPNLLHGFRALRREYQPFFWRAFPSCINYSISPPTRFETP